MATHYDGDTAIHGGITDRGTTVHSGTDDGGMKVYGGTKFQLGFLHFGFGLGGVVMVVRVLKM